MKEQYGCNGVICSAFRPHPPSPCPADYADAAEKMTLIFILLIQRNLPAMKIFIWLLK
jgi:hypothetical protein